MMTKYIWIIITLFFCSCTGRKLSFKSPEIIRTERHYAQKLTELNVPISIDLEGLKSSIKNDLPTPLSESSGHTDVNVPYIIIEMVEKLVSQIYSWVEKIPVIGDLFGLVESITKTATRMVKQIVPTEVEKIVAVGVNAKGAVYLDDVHITSGSNNQVNIRIDLSIKIDIDIDDKEVGLKTDFLACSGGNRMKLRMNLNFIPKWTTAGNIELSNMNWEEEFVDGCTIIRIGDEHLSVEDLIKLPLIKEAVHKQIESQVEEVLPNKIELNESIVAFWNKSLLKTQVDTISDPVLKSNNLFLKFSINPEKILLEENLYVANNQLHTAIGVRANPRMDVVSKIDTTAYEPSLPEIEIVDKIEQKSVLSIGASLELEELTNAIKNEVLDSLFEVEDNKFVKIKELSLFQSDSLLVFKLRLRKALRGDMYIYGNPYYDSTLDEIKLQNIQLSLDSKFNPIPTLAVLFFNKDVKVFLEKFGLAVNLKPIIDEINNSKIVLDKESNSLWELNNVTLKEVDVLLSKGLLLIDASTELETKITGFKK